MYFIHQRRTLVLLNEMSHDLSDTGYWIPDTLGHIILGCNIFHGKRRIIPLPTCIKE